MAELSPDLSGEWRFDPNHTRIGFSTRHAMVTTVRGSSCSRRTALGIAYTSPGSTSRTMSTVIGRPTATDQSAHSSPFRVSQPLSEEQGPPWLNRPLT